MPILEHLDSTAGADAVVATVVLTKIILDAQTALQPFYWRAEGVEGTVIGAVQAGGDGALRIAQGATVSFDTYFNALFERHWRLHTCAGALTLSLQVEGRAAVRIWRRSPDTGRALLHEQEVAGLTRIAVPMDAPHYRQAGLLWFDLTALDGPAALRGASWSTPGAGQPPARLGVVICTFNREPELAAVLAAIAGSEDLGAAVARVIVVNQGRPGLAAQPGVCAAAAARLGPRLRMVEQGCGSDQGNTQNEKSLYHQSSVDFRCYLEMALFEPHHPLGHDGVASTRPRWSLHVNRLSPYLSGLVFTLAG